MIDPGSEKRLGIALFGGIGLVVLGLFLLGFMLFSGAYWSLPSQGKGISAIIGYIFIPLLVMLTGMILAGGALYRMWAIPRQQAADSTVSEFQDAFIVSKFAIDEYGLMNFPADPDPETDFKFHVQIQFPDGRRAELRTAPEVYFSIGEGMKGAAKVQGNWLGSFIPNQFSQSPDDRDH